MKSILAIVLGLALLSTPAQAKTESLKDEAVIISLLAVSALVSVFIFSSNKEDMPLSP